jgi:hypothetical protein
MSPGRVPPGYIPLHQGVQGGAVDYSTAAIDDGGAEGYSAIVSNPPTEPYYYDNNADYFNGTYTSNATAIVDGSRRNSAGNGAAVTAMSAMSAVVVAAQAGSQVDMVGPDNPVVQIRENWSACWDGEAGAVYYYNHISGEATWLPPPND